MSQRETREQKARTVFVGNIAFNATEEDLVNLFSSVGTVVNTRIVTDKETGKRKGFGFIEMADRDTALSAARNLNDLDFHSRTLRVNIADDAGGRAGGDSRKRGRDGERGGAAGGAAAGSSAELTGDAALFAPVTGDGLEPVADPVARHVYRVERAELFELLKQTKKYAASMPREARQLLRSQPQLYAALQLGLNRLAGPAWPLPVAHWVRGTRLSSLSSLRCAYQ